MFFFFSSRRRHTRSLRDWSSDVCSSDLSAFGAHRWRWSLHLNAYLSEALIVTGDSARALEHADRVLRQARETGSMKYEARSEERRVGKEGGCRGWRVAGR